MLGIKGELSFVDHGVDFVGLFYMREGVAVAVVCRVAGLFRLGDLGVLSFRYFSVFLGGRFAVSGLLGLCERRTTIVDYNEVCGFGWL